MEQAPIAMGGYSQDDKSQSPRSRLRRSFSAPEANYVTKLAQGICHLE
jgi:hypothetical protein